MTAKELKLDYFQIYDLENRPAAGNILLQGQFDEKRLKMQGRSSTSSATRSQKTANLCTTRTRT